MAAFVRDRCVKGPNEWVYVDDLYRAFREWADDNGHVKPTKQTFGRDLRAAVAGRLKLARVGGHDSNDRARAYTGIGLKLSA